MIAVHQTSGGNPLQFTVKVSKGTGETTHRVTMSSSTYEKLTGGRSSAERFVQAAFEFLLEREPKEAILRSFDISVINRYFPEFEGAIGAYLNR